MPQFFNSTEATLLDVSMTMGQEKATGALMVFSGLLAMNKSTRTILEQFNI